MDFLLMAAYGRVGCQVIRSLLLLSSDTRINLVGSYKCYLKPIQNYKRGGSNDG